MSVKECYKKYKNLKGEAKRMEKKLYEASRYMSKVVSYIDEDSEVCFRWNVDYLELGPLLHVCPKFEQTSLDNLSQCQSCKCLSKRLHYEFYRNECMRIDKEKNLAKQNLLRAIKNSVTKSK
ncbi:MAG: hypothetical protein ACLRFJ_00160 [Alphaproteobacteria bacterium]